MANVTHCDRCNEPVTGRPSARALSVQIGRDVADTLGFVPMLLESPSGGMPIVKVTLSALQMDMGAGDRSSGLDLCTVCFLAVLEAFYKAHQGAIGAGRG